MFAILGGSKFEDGIYFSTTSSEALDYSSKNSAWEGFIFLARVATGVSTSEIWPYDHSLYGDFHSTRRLDNNGNLLGYVVYDLAAAYPEYLIKCCWRGQF